MPEWSISKMRPVDWLSVAVIVAVMAAAAYLSLGLSFTKLRRLHHEQTQLARELEALTQIRNAVLNAEATLAEMKAQQEHLARQIPHSINFGFYGGLSGAADDAGVVLEHVTPGTVGQAARYLVLPVEVTARGEFHHLYDFLYRLTHLPRLTKVERLVMLATDDPGACTLTLTLQVYAALPGAGI
jgi:Tfp pilus assembly protein PilO